MKTEQHRTKVKKRKQKQTKNLGFYHMQKLCKLDKQLKLKKNKKQKTKDRKYKHVLCILKLRKNVKGSILKVQKNYTYNRLIPNFFLSGYNLSSGSLLIGPCTGPSSSSFPTDTEDKLGEL